MRTITFPIVRLVSIILVLLSPTEGPAETLAIVGSTVIDVSNFGNGTADLEDAVVVIEGDLIVAVGPRSEVEIPSSARVLDAHDRFIVPGLTDGFAALNNQAYADAYLECGVTSIIAVSGGRRGPLAGDLHPSPNINRLESVGDGPGTLEEHFAVLEDLAAGGEKSRPDGRRMFWCSRRIPAKTFATYVRSRRSCWPAAWWSGRARGKTAAMRSSAQRAPGGTRSIDPGVAGPLRARR